ncbi:MAG: helix-turn-helix domain-containing protein [Bacillota bacterium]
MKNLQPDYEGLRVLLAKNKMYLNDLRKIGVNSGALLKVNNNEFVSLKVLAAICGHFDCKLQDLVELKEEKDLPE